MKKEALKARGIRFHSKTWNEVKRRAKMGKVYPSDIVRVSVEKYLKDSA